MTPFELVKLAAAVWYISYAVTKTHGIFGIFEKLREFKGGRWHGRTFKDVEITDHIGQSAKVGEMPNNDGLLDCIICLSIWVALVLVLIGSNVVTDAFAVAGLALWVHSFSGWRINL